MTKYHGQEVAHIWANQHTNGVDRAEGNGNIYFRGDTIYSYGSHFPIARHVTHKGNRAVLMTTRTNSVTTGKHIGYVVSALKGSGLPVFHVDPAAEPGDARPEYEHRRMLLVGKIGTSTRPTPKLLRDLAALVDEANAFAEFFGYRWRLTVPADMGAEVRKIARAKAARARAAAKAEAARLAARKIALAGDIEDWRAGELRSLPSDAGTLLRINGDEIETSHHARFPIYAATRAFPIIKRCHDRKSEWREDGSRLRLGHYAIDRVDADGTVHAGCHVVPWAEVERIARQLGLLEVDPDEVEVSDHPSA